MQRREIIRLVRHQHGHESFRVGRDIVPVEDALRIAAPLLADRQQSAEPRIGGTVRRVDQDRNPVGEVEPTADDQPNPCRLRRLMRAHDARQGIPVDDAQRFDPAGMRLSEQLVGRRGSTEEAEVRGDLKLGIAQGETPPGIHRRCSYYVPRPLSIVNRPFDRRERGGMLTVCFWVAELGKRSFM